MGSEMCIRDRARAAFEDNSIENINEKVMVKIFENIPAQYRNSILTEYRLHQDLHAQGGFLTDRPAGESFVTRIPKLLTQAGYVPQSRPEKPKDRQNKRQPGHPLSLLAMQEQPQTPLQGSPMPYTQIAHNAVGGIGGGKDAVLCAICV